ncbi:hypothetical protein LguiA_029273 [Lonicera macranthoides]
MVHLCFKQVFLGFLWELFGPRLFLCHRKKKCHLVVPDDVENDVHTEHIKSRKSLCKKEKGFDSQRKPCMNSTSEGAEKSDDIDETMPSVKR